MRRKEHDLRQLTTLGERLVLDATSPDVGMRIDAFLAQRMPWRTRTSIQRLIRDGKVALLDHRPVKAARKILAGDVVQVLLPKPKRDVEMMGRDQQLEVLFEDAYLIAINKPAGVPVHPSGRLLHHTIITTLHQRFRNHQDPERDIVPKLCHRLDLETSGVLLIGKDEQVHAEVSRQFQQRETRKIYLAIVHGEMVPDTGLIDLPIGMANNSPIKKKRAVCGEGGQPARTRFAVERRLNGFSLVRLELLTGRHHQLRVHLSAIGHPIVGDKMYGLDEDFFLKYYQGALTEEHQRALLLPRQALHAHQLTFRHPVLQRSITIEAPLGDDLATFLEQHLGSRPA
ncbi:MAG: RluA family pseudouridine synthase [Planctomycetota bacterium]